MENTYIGSVDIYKNGVIAGWACSTDGKNCLVELLINNVTIGFFPCDKGREDLQKQRICEQGGGFYIDARSFLRIGKNTAQVKLPNGNHLSKNELTIDYQQSVTVFGSFALPYKNRLEIKKIGVHGNYAFGAELKLGSVLSKIIEVLNLQPSRGGEGDEDLHIFFNAPERSRQDVPESSINYFFQSNLKSDIDVVHKRIFGRSVCITAREIVPEGHYLTKSDANAVHDGKVRSYEEVKQLKRKDLEGVVLQRVINNILDEKSVFDVRVPVIGNEIPFVYLKSRPQSDRFSNTNSTACVVGALDIFKREEIEQILTFCKVLHLEYGELDILVDSKTKDIWIVDVNNTPAGPPNGLSRKEMDVSVGLLAGAFYRNFVDKDFKMFR